MGSGLPRVGMASIAVAVDRVARPRACICAVVFGLGITAAASGLSGGGRVQQELHPSPHSFTATKPPFKITMRSIGVALGPLVPFDPLRAGTWRVNLARSRARFLVQFVSLTTAARIDVWLRPTGENGQLVVLKAHAVPALAAARARHNVTAVVAKAIGSFGDRRADLFFGCNLTCDANPDGTVSVEIQGQPFVPWYELYWTCSPAGKIVRSFRPTG